MAAEFDDPETTAGRELLAHAARLARARLGDGLLSAYAIGSLAHGGFSRSVSDLDLALLTDERSDRDAAALIRDLRREAIARDGDLGERLSVFHVPWARFADPPASARFPPIDRQDLMTSGVLLLGHDLRSRCGSMPSAGAVRGQAVDAALERATPDRLAGELSALRDAGGVHDASKAVLWPVRLQHVCDRGAASGNADAVAHYLGHGDARHPALVADALAWRSLPVLPSPETAVPRIADELFDLYAEVLARVSEGPGVPRRGELRDRARLLAGG